MGTSWIKRQLNRKERRVTRRRIESQQDLEFVSRRRVWKISFLKRAKQERVNHG